MMIQAPMPSLTSERRHHNTHQDSEAQASNPVKKISSFRISLWSCKQQKQTERDLTAGGRNPQGGGEGWTQEVSQVLSNLTPYIPNSAVLFGPL